MVSIEVATNNTDFSVIRSVIRKYRHIPTNKLSTRHAHEIISTLSRLGYVDYADKLSLRSVNGCNVSKLVLQELNMSALCKARRAGFAEAVKRRDNFTCWLTGFTLQTEAAHIIPFSCCITDTLKYDMNNGICLDSRVHGLWDSGQIICIPDIMRKTIQFEIQNESDRDELIKMVPELANPVSVPVMDCEMLGYFCERYRLDNAKSIDTEIGH